MSPTRLILVLLALVIAMSSMAVGYSWSSIKNGRHHVQMGQLGLSFTDVACSDPLGTPDLGVTPPKDVGWTECLLVDTDHDGDFDVLQISVTNAYPGYQVNVNNITIAATGTIPVYITNTQLVHNDDPDSIAYVLEGFWTQTNLVCELLVPGGHVIGGLWISMLVNQPALQNHTYTFQVDITGAQFNQVCQDLDLGGTPGFWKNWDSHDTYTQAEIEGWLAQIDAASAWLGPTSTSGMVEVLSYGGPQALPKFRKHYLATRLNAASGRLGLARVHNITGLDEDNDLGLLHPQAASLGDILAAMEAQFGSADADLLGIMKDICDALNNLEI